MVAVAAEARGAPRSASLLLILRATQLALGLYVAYNLAAALASVPAGRPE